MSLIAPRNLKNAGIQADKAKVKTAARLELLADPRYFAKGSTQEFRMSKAKQILAAITNVKDIKTQNAMVRSYLLKNATDIIDDPAKSRTDVKDVSDLGNLPVPDKKIAQSVYMNLDHCIQGLSNPNTYNLSQENATAYCSSIFAGPNYNTTKATPVTSQAPVPKQSVRSASSSIPDWAQTVGDLGGIPNLESNSSSFRNASSQKQYHDALNMTTADIQIAKSDAILERRNDRVKSAAKSEIPYHLRLSGELDVQ